MDPLATLRSTATAVAAAAGTASDHDRPPENPHGRLRWTFQTPDEEETGDPTAEARDPAAGEEPTADGPTDGGTDDESEAGDATDDESDGARDDGSGDDGGPSPVGDPDVPDGSGGGVPVTARGWRRVDSPIDETLYGVVGTRGGAFAVGVGGVVLNRTPSGEWRVAVPNGPAAKHNTLTAVAASDDRRRIWFAGSSGALGCYDVTAGRKYDYSAPMEMTSTWEAVAIGGDRGEECLYVANGSGEVLPIGVDARNCPTWGEAEKPGSGSTVPAVAVADGAVYAADTSGNVFAADDDDGWHRIGIENAQVNFTDVHAGADGRVLVAGGGGIVYRFDRPCRNWTPIAVGTAVLRAIDAVGDRIAAVGDGGRAYRRRAGSGWVAEATDAEGTLYDVALARPGDGDGGVDVAVGEGGVLVERDPETVDAAREAPPGEGSLREESAGEASPREESAGEASARDEPTEGGPSAIDEGGER